ncbi:uncharacterized protein DUF4375 [Neolewinella xylanilytica]|uniref:Uncharacterized protein DUF4375 n=1 Tax=Neolewinella xylanilytica TaxID=1514080 RepID=A0A2S6HZM0_9BACT|nr:DUF4375 domain-containing protein [Neolewinella xylanilytica]PPK83787.1 uncharacterized protein DUF4375 [Neolewinella xylanilytica]
MKAVLIKILQYVGFKSSKSDTSFDEISRSIDDNRLQIKNTIVSHELIASSDSFDLVYLIFNKIINELPEDYTRQSQYIIQELNEGQRAIYITWVWEGEINNGGFNQFYANPSRQYADILPDLLLFIGASSFAELMVRANILYAQNMQNIKRHQDGTLEGFSKSYDDNPLNDLDKVFYDLNEKNELINYQANFIRTNASLFVKE